ncbi:type I-E CRISPR-associated protein Cas6/Cse3/CasE [Anaeromyxobacter paludicola]|uniref:Type I-E CRISPR-associated protein Cas6/Cse3/CasE n=1 Tax=Anaeromyxobacter paludicola TaxID=2918171 RepID=A0ABM7XDZ2_9BACT|nr:type I-E CRISPR-associated protein Cas6/Cse3/CasE [Anaeromyxobacter paludicola]BDG10095.1 type I-E CRISPR-associated protein Cas6/Cse3/CasE [Anaeromyxobacter paludicola]
MFLSRVELDARAAEHEEFWREVSSPYGSHQAIWKLLSRSADQKRDFLYRAEESSRQPTFLVLSAAPPAAHGNGMWRVESKEFAPALKEGQRLAFRLRASPVVRRGKRVPERKNRKVQRHDVVMDLAKRLESEGRPVPPEPVLVGEAGTAWLISQGERAGFKLATTTIEELADDGLFENRERPSLRVGGYRQHRILRRGEQPVRFSTLDFEGVLEVTNPAAFLARVAQGFGPQKAFGCGLMLLRRA